MKVLAAAVAALALAAAPASVAASEAAAPRLSRPTFIDPDIVSQLPRDLADRMVKDGVGDTFYVPDSTAETRSVVAAPKRMRFLESRARAAAKQPTPVVEQHREEPREEPRRQTNRGPADDARRRRDFEAWELRRQELGAQQVEQALQQPQPQQQPRFAEVPQRQAPQQQQQPPQQPPANLDEDGEDDLDEDMTPAQLQLESRRRREAAQARAQAAASASAAATRNVAMRFAEARRAARPLVQAYPPASERGTTDLAGHVMQSRLARGEARMREREAAEDRERAEAGPVVMLETESSERPRRHLFEMTPEELRAAFRAHRRGQQQRSEGGVADRLAAREEAGPADMPRFAAAPAAPPSGAPALVEEHGIRVTHYEPFRRS